MEHFRNQRLGLELGLTRGPGWPGGGSGGEGGGCGGRSVPRDPLGPGSDSDRPIPGLQSTVLSSSSRPRALDGTGACPRPQGWLPPGPRGRRLCAPAAAGCLGPSCCLCLSRPASHSHLGGSEPQLLRQTGQGRGRPPHSPHPRPRPPEAHPEGRPSSLPAESPAPAPSQEGPQGQACHHRVGIPICFPRAPLGRNPSASWPGTLGSKAPELSERGAGATGSAPRPDAGGVSSPGDQMAVGRPGVSSLGSPGRRDHTHPLP